MLDPWSSGPPARAMRVVGQRRVVAERRVERRRLSLSPQPDATPPAVPVRSCEGPVPPQSSLAYGVWQDAAESDGSSNLWDGLEYQMGGIPLILLLGGRPRK